MAGDLSPRRATQLNLALAVAWTAFALAVLPSHGHFLDDEALFWQQSLDVLRNHAPAAYGSYISNTNPMRYTPGGGPFDLFAVAFVFTDDPVAGSIWVVLLAGIGLLL